MMLGAISLIFKMSKTSPLTRNRANNAIVRSTISTLLETIIDGRLKRPNQCLIRQLLRSMRCVLGFRLNEF